MTTYSCLIVDDEPLARQTLRRLVERHDQLRVVGEAANGQDALELAQALSPDVVFLDIRMPGMSGLEVAAGMGGNARVIFTTAFDEFAVAAFELQALDYLLKPFGWRRFEQAVSRLSEYAGQEWQRERLEDAADDRPVRRLFVRHRGRLIRIPTDSITHIVAADDYAELVTGEGRHLMAARMHTLEYHLDRDRFVRIHRSVIVNLDHVEEAAPCGNGRWEVVLNDGTTLTSSRSGSARLRESLGLMD